MFRKFAVLSLVLIATIDQARAADAARGPVRCPPSLLVRDQPEAPTGWVGDAGSAEHRFERASLFEGAMGEQRKPAPVDLAPDSDTREGATAKQLWKLDAYEGVLLVCRYQGTRATLALQVPDSIQTCEQVLPLDASGHVDGVKDPAMSCR
jgi:hypothetical protein